MHRTILNLEGRAEVVLGIVQRQNPFEHRVMLTNDPGRALLDRTRQAETPEAVHVDHSLARLQAQPGDIHAVEHGDRCRAAAEHQLVRRGQLRRVNGVMSAAVDGDRIEEQAGPGEITNRRGAVDAAHGVDRDLLDIVEFADDHAVAGHDNLGRRFQPGVTRRGCRGGGIDDVGLDGVVARHHEPVTSRAVAAAIDEVATMTNCPVDDVIATIGKDGIIAARS